MKSVAHVERDESAVADRESGQEVQGDGGYAEAIRDTGEDGQADGDRAELTNASGVFSVVAARTEVTVRAVRGAA